MQSVFTFFYDISSSYYFALWADAHAFVHLVGLESTIQIKCFNCIYLIIKYRSFIIQCTSCEPHFFTVPQFLGALASVHCKHVSASEKTLASIRFWFLSHKSLAMVRPLKFVPHRDALKHFCKQSRPKSGSSCKSCLIRVLYDPSIVDLTVNFFVLCKSMKSAFKPSSKTSLLTFPRRYFFCGSFVLFM